MKSEIIRKYLLGTSLVYHDCYSTTLTNDGTNNVTIKQNKCDDVILETGDSISFGGEFLNEKLTNNKIQIVPVGATDCKVLLEKKYISLS